MVIEKVNGKDCRIINFVKECEVAIPIEDALTNEQVERIIKNIVESEEPTAIDYAWKDVDEEATLYGSIY